MNDERVRSVLYQLVVAAAVILVARYLFINTSENLEARGMSSGFEFLGSTAGFSIAWSVLPYEAGDSYLHVYLVGIVNTLAASLVAIVRSEEHTSELQSLMRTSYAVLCLN